MELTRLKELMAARVDETVITEASKKQEADFDGIRSIVEDALGDLSDKLGKSGSLATLFKSCGASKLDTHKDADGKTVLAQIVAKTTEFKKAMESLMTEAELLVNQAQMSEGIEMDDDAELLTEAKEYSDSSDFTDEFYGIVQQVAKIKQAMKNQRWIGWMKTTDDNFGTDTQTPARAAITAINSLDAQLGDIDDELDKAS